MERNTKNMGITQYIYSIEEIRKIVSEIAKQYGVERVTLFGSYARGEARGNSDINLRDSLDHKFLERINKEEILIYEQ